MSDISNQEFGVRIVAPPRCLTRHAKVQKVFNQVLKDLSTGKRHIGRFGNENLRESGWVVICNGKHTLGLVCMASEYITPIAGEEPSIDICYGDEPVSSKELIARAIENGAADYGYHTTYPIAL